MSTPWHWGAFGGAQKELIPWNEHAIRAEGGVGIQGLGKRPLLWLEHWRGEGFSPLVDGMNISEERRCARWKQA